MPGKKKKKKEEEEEEEVYGSQCLRQDSNQAPQNTSPDTPSCFIPY
jgi:hypothetical protein